MIIRSCPTCGGAHYGSLKCPCIEAPCVVCGDPTILACSDCAIDSGGRGSVHVCSKTACRDKHEGERHVDAAEWGRSILATAEAGAEHSALVQQ
jgi:hypothetical protein